MERSEKKQLIAALAKSPHGQLSAYVTPMLKAITEDADFAAHLVSWNAAKGAVRDAKNALPVITLIDPLRDEHGVFIENACAHLAALNPRELLKALEFARTLTYGGDAISNRPVIKPRATLLRRLVTRYLHDLEADRRDWERTVLRHRHPVKSLYAWYGVKPNALAKGVLFDDPTPVKIGPLAVLKTLGSLPNPDEVAGLILKHRLPFLMARGAVGKRAEEPAIAMALIKVATATELVTNVKAFERLGIKTVPALRAAFEEALTKAGKTKQRGATLKATRAAEVLEEGGEDKLAGKLRVVQEQQLNALTGVDGDWLILADRSGSMSSELEVARVMASTLARMVKGKIHLIFFDTDPRYFDATGKTYDELKKMTATITAGGSTSIGCGLKYVIDRQLAVDGIAIVSDGGENALPHFAPTYQKYVQALGNEPVVYFYNTSGASGNVLTQSCTKLDIDVQHFDIRQGKVDHYSLPNLVQTMRVNQYGLVEEVYAAPLVTVDDILTRTRGEVVVRHQYQTA